MRKKLYINIGYPKTATTTLQKHYFTQIKDLYYLGKFDESKNGFKLKKEIVEDLKFTNISSIKYYKNNFSRALYEIIEGDKALLSEEALLGSCLFFRKDLIYGNLKLVSIYELIRMIKMLFDEKFFDIKIIITIRNQTDIIPSLYAQAFRMSYSKIASLNTFEKYIQHITMDTNSPIASHLDYFEVSNLLEKEFGNENILILPYEEFIKNKKSFLESLASFMCISFDSSILGNSFIENQRTLKNGKKKYDKFTLLELLAKFKNKFFPNSSFCISKQMKFLFSFELPLTKKPGDIKLTEKQKKILFDIYKNTNKNLSDKYQLKLNDYGYY
jgi:hypothetical protein